MSETIWVVTCTDYDGPRDEDGSTSVVGHYATEEEADEAAEDILEEEEFEGVERDDNFLRDTFYGTPTLPVNVECIEVRKRKAAPEPVPETPKPVVEAPSPQRNFGPMISIPIGKVNGLKGASYKGIECR